MMSERVPRTLGLKSLGTSSRLCMFTGKSCIKTSQLNVVSALYRVKKSFIFCTNTSRPMSEIASVKGSCLGQAITQFCAKPHS